MLKWINKKRNNKGFTLVELIVVIAIIGIIGAIAVPRFTAIRERSAINADAATAQQIVAAARMVEADLNLEAGAALTNDGKWNTNADPVGNEYMELPVEPQSIKKGTKVFNVMHDDETYTLTWTTTGSSAGTHTYTEGEDFQIDKTTPENNDKD